MSDDLFKLSKAKLVDMIRELRGRLPPAPKEGEVWLMRDGTRHLSFGPSFDDPDVIECVEMGFDDVGEFSLYVTHDTAKEEIHPSQFEKRIGRILLEWDHGDG